MPALVVARFLVPLCLALDPVPLPRDRTRAVQAKARDAGENPCHPDQAPVANASTQIPASFLNPARHKGLVRVVRIRGGRQPDLRGEAGRVQARGCRAAARWPQVHRTPGAW
jgi:hypothetical protein